MLKGKMITGRGVELFSFMVFGIYLIYRLVLIFYPHPDAGGVENNVIWFIQRLVDGGHLYTDPESSPYAIAQYGPLYYYINAGVAKLLGIGADDVLTLFSLSRTVSLFFNIVFSIIIIATAKNVFNAARRQAWVAGIFAFIFLDITSFSRPDSLSHVFFFLSFYCFVLQIKKSETGSKATGYFLLSAVLAACALFSKQSALVLPVIVFIWFVRKREAKPFLLWALTYATTAAALLCIVHVESGIRPFFQNTVAGINNGVSINWFFHTIILDFYRQFGLLWVPALILVITIMKKAKDGYYRFAVISLITCFIFSNLTALKWGSTPGYFTEWVALVFISMAACWQFVFAALKDIYRKIAGATIIFIVMIKLLLIVYPLWNMIRPGARQSAMRKYNQQAELATHIKNKLRDKPGATIFNKIYTPEFYLCNLLFRESVMPQLEVVVYGTWTNKVFDYTSFRREITNGRVQYVVGKPGSALQFMDIPLSMFRFTDSLAGQYIYQYNP